MESSKKKNRESELEKKKERMIVLERSWGLNEGEKEKEGGGDRDGTMCVEEEGDSVEKKKTCMEKKKKYANRHAYGWNEKREIRNNMKNKKSYLRNVTTIFLQ